MNGLQFEHEVARILNANEYENVRVTSGSGDFGVDVLAEKDGIKYAIQCKYYSEQAGVAAIQQAYSGKSYYDCDHAIVIASHGFTNAAKELAMKLNVELWDKSDLMQMTEITEDDMHVPTFEDVCFLERIKTEDYDVPIGTKNTGEVVICNLLKSGNILVCGDSLSPIDSYMHILLLPLLYKNAPDALRVLVIDSRMLEYGQYQKQSNLLIPVVTDLKRAAGALMWATMEMKKRFQLFVESNCRDLESYNKQVAHHGKGTLPYVGIYINDLGDLIEDNEVIDCIQQIHIRGYSAGIYMVAYTRNPYNTNGWKKAISGFQTKICLKVSSPEASRAILDSREAIYIQENELIFKSRLFSGEQRLKTIDFDLDDVLYYQILIKNRRNQNNDFDEEALLSITGAKKEDYKTVSSIDATETTFGNNPDEMLEDAVDVVFEDGMASVSILQRRLKLGYSRAARIVDQMEEVGIVGPFEGSKPRPLLITREEWIMRKSLGGLSKKEIKYCPQCGKQNPSHAHFCAFCGSGFVV